MADIQLIENIENIALIIAALIVIALSALWINSNTNINVLAIVGKVLYFLFSMVFGLSIGLIIGLFEGAFKPRPYAYARRRAVASAFKAGFSLLCSLPGVRYYVGIERKSRRISSQWWQHSTLNPATARTCWRPLRTLARLYGSVYHDAKMHPYSVLRGLSIGAWLASRLPRFK